MNVRFSLHSGFGFYSEHRYCQRSVVGRPISSRMNSSVAIRAKRNDVPRIVGATIGHSSNVMRFQVWNSIRTKKGGRGFAPFAIAHSSGNDIVTNISTAFENSSRHLRFAWAVFRRLHGLFAHCCEIRRRHSDCRRDLFNDLDNASDGPQLKDDGVSDIVFTIWRAFDVVRVIDKLILKSEAGFCFGKKKQALTVNGVVRYCFVAGANGHVADLAFAKVFKHTIRTPSVSIAVFKAFLAGNDNDQSMLGRRDDAALLLAPIRCVNVFAPIVNTAALKAPTHGISPTTYTPIGPFHFDREFTMGAAA
jgi:hypothetical protein